MDEQEVERRLLEEFYPDGSVATGFVYGFELQTEPVERVLFVLTTQAGVTLARIWFERDQFGEFAEMVQQVAKDAGCRTEEPAN